MEALEALNEAKAAVVKLNQQVQDQKKEIRGAFHLALIDPPSHTACGKLITETTFWGFDEPTCKRCREIAIERARVEAPVRARRRIAP